MPDERLFYAMEHLREELYRIKQQLRLYAQLTVHETRTPITIQSEAFSVCMTQLADQVDAAISHTELLCLKASALGVEGGSEEPD